MTKQTPRISIPNIITIIRILLTPLFVILLLRDLFGTALVVFAVAGISDGLDGFIARYFNQRTPLGAWLDPMADKLLLVSAFVALAILSIIPPWMAVVVIARDVIITLGIAVLTLTEKEYEVRPSVVSKCTTTAQIITVMLSLFDPTRSILASLHLPILWLTAILTMLSGLHYIFIGMRILQEPNNTNKQVRD